MVASSVGALRGFLENSLTRDLECVRIARAAKAVSDVDGFREMGSDPIVAFLRNRQCSDGGWTDPDETAWALHFLAKSKSDDRASLARATSWLTNQRQTRGGWGRHPRDSARIPTTALVIALVPSIVAAIDRNRIREIWYSDMAGPVVLSYKGGFYLIAESKTEKNTMEAVDSTIALLQTMQNCDGGFGPWKNHPIGSDPWSTGVVLWGLSRWIDRVDPMVIERALDWLAVNQLPSGYWRYHYLDEGASYALIGAVSAMKALAVFK